ncbi:MAG: YwaF family protein [Clostridia bacterium]|nr:YwaF family protein [Clostridia bacterium]
MGIQQTISIPTLNSSGGKMSFWQNLFKGLDASMTTPTTFGWYHFLCLAIVIGLCVVIAIYCRNLSDKRYDQILLYTSIALIAFEIYKQLNYSYDWETNTWDYQWYAFPYQFCSTPMYVMPLALIFRKKKLARDACRAYLGTYALFAGLAVMIYPGDVFIKTIGINIQTMIHHGSMVVIGVLTWVSGKAKLNHKTILYAAPVFAALIAVATGANILWHFVGNDETFNMFYISPYFDCTLPILSSIQPLVPYPVFLIGYLVGFTAAGYVMFLFALLFNTIFQKVRGRIQLKKQKTK